MGRVALEQAYPALAFRPRTRNWWARLVGQAPECVHLETDTQWMATLIPDAVYLCGKGSVVRQPPRPEVSLCRACLLGVIEPELVAYAGRVVAFEPNFETLSQYFFVAPEDFAPAGLETDVAAAIRERLKKSAAKCGRCERRASWLWLDRTAVASLDDFDRIRSAPGQWLCATHAAATLCRSLNAADEANLFYVNLPYGDAGAYLWI